MNENINEQITRNYFLSSTFFPFLTSISNGKELYTDKLLTNIIAEIYNIIKYIKSQIVFAFSTAKVL